MDLQEQLVDVQEPLPRPIDVLARYQPRDEEDTNRFLNFDGDVAMATPNPDDEPMPLVIGR